MALEIIASRAGKLATGEFKTIVTVRSLSLVSTFTSARLHLYTPSARERSSEAITSSAVTGFPLWKRAPSRRENVYVSPLELTVACSASASSTAVAVGFARRSPCAMFEMMMLSVRACVHTGSSFNGIVVYAHVNVPPRVGAGAPSEMPRHPLSAASPAPANAVPRNLRRLTPHLPTPVHGHRTSRSPRTLAIALSDNRLPRWSEPMVASPTGLQMATA